MALLGMTWHRERNGETTEDRGWLLSLKRRGWCWWHHSNEAGCRVVQVGPLILEIWERGS